MIRIGLLGAGRIGQVHARAVSSVPTAQLVAIADPISAAAGAVRNTYGCDIRTIEQILVSDDIDAVIICTPTDTHADLIEQFARAGKAIFCEKPVDLDLERVQACLSVVNETNTTLMVGFQRRYDPDFQALRAAIDAGQIGDVEMVSLISRDPGAPPYDYIERSGGIFRDMMIHDFDVARWMLGEEVETVQAAASVLTDPEIGNRGDFDSANAILRTASGRQCTITNSRRATFGYDQRIEVHGSAGSVAADNHHQSRITVANGHGYTRPPLLDFFMTRYIVAYDAEIKHFVDCVANRAQPRTSGHDGLMSIALAEAALESVRTGAAVRPVDILNRKK
jgi:myo-inositol 2-dehydrogenase/D-chiro-inositol 1-dehydrogenase|tara:strand:+ start:173 stop:1183 length:1011 start_codon:yes stop_codon:yes gene_type:complete